MKKFTAFVFARGGSKGIKDKNIRQVGGKPLLAHSIECALGSRYVDRVIVSTDSEPIAEVALRYGAEVLKRPDELASDTSAENLSWQHAIKHLPEIFSDPATSLFLSLPATAPLRASIDVDHAVERYQSGGCDVVMGISPSHRSPYLNMVTTTTDGLISIAMKGSTAWRRQDVPDVFDITTCVYVANPEFILRTKRLLDGRVGYVLIPPERALDIDEEFDLHLADLLLTHPFVRKEIGGK